MARILDRGVSTTRGWRTATFALAGGTVFDYGQFDGEFMVKASRDELEALYNVLRVEFAKTSDEADVYTAGKPYVGTVDAEPRYETHQ